MIPTPQPPKRQQELIPIGQLVEGPDRRDAVHVAIISCTAKTTLFPATPVDEHGMADNDGGAVGIVDPFLSLPVKPGERFWLMLYPNTVETIRHHWKHERFPDE